MSAVLIVPSEKEEGEYGKSCLLCQLYHLKKKKGNMASHVCWAADKSGQAAHRVPPAPPIPSIPHPPPHHPINLSAAARTQQVINKFSSKCGQDHATSQSFLPHQFAVLSLV